MNSKIQNLHKFHFIDSYPGGRVQGIVQIVAQFADIELDLHQVQASQLKKPQVIQACGVLGKLPALTFPNGVSISGLGPIIQYFAKISKNPIYGQNLEESSLIDQWVNVSINDLLRLVYTYLNPLSGEVTVTKSEHEESLKELRSWSKIISNHLELRTYLVGNSISVADISIGFDKKFAKNYANLTRWLTYVTSNPVFEKYLGQFYVQQKQAEFVSFKQ